MLPNIGINARDSDYLLIDSHEYLPFCPDRQGLGLEMCWLDGEEVTATDSFNIGSRVLKTGFPVKNTSSRIRSDFISPARTAKGPSFTSTLP